MNGKHGFELDKSQFKITSLHENDEKTYWLSKSPAERLLALETMRRIAYGYDPFTTRFQRFFEIIQREPR